MKKQDIIEELKKHDSTFMSFPDRGPWGNNKYRGNCSGWYHAFLIWKYHVEKMAELFSGGGTGYDVCQDIYAEIEGHKKCNLNPHWKDKVRQVLQTYNIFQSPERGFWKMAA